MIIASFHERTKPIFGLFSVWLLVVLSFDRWRAVCHPKISLSLWKSRLQRLNLFIVFCFSFLFSAPKMAEYQVEVSKICTQILCLCTLNSDGNRMKSSWGSKFAQYFLLLRICSYKIEWNMVKFEEIEEKKFLHLQNHANACTNRFEHFIDNDIASKPHDWLIKLNNNVPVLVSSCRIKLFVHLIPSLQYIITKHSHYE